MSKFLSDATANQKTVFAAKFNPRFGRLRLLPSVFMVIGLTVGALTGCEQSPTTANGEAELASASAVSPATNNNKSASSKQFIGCYSISEDEAAQIKISEQAGGLVMQMPEADPENPEKSSWDTPEPLESIALAQVPQYFSIDAENVTAMIGRPDRILVIAHINPAYVNINPLLDSDYLGFIYQGANTIFKVDCDLNEKSIVQSQ